MGADAMASAPFSSITTSDESIVTSTFVMAGLDPAIHDLKKHFDFNEVVDARHKVGHDGV
jgi:hypothetical protein